MSKVRNISMSDTGSNVSVDSEREVNEKKWSDKKWAKILIAVVLSVGSYLLSYFLIRAIIPEEKIVWWLVDVFSFIMSFLFLAGISTAINEKTEMGKPVFLFTLILFIFFLMGGYNNNVEPKTSRTSSKQVLSSSKKSVKTKVFSKGSYNLNLAKNQKSGWIKINGAYNFNKDASLVVEYASGVIVNSWGSGKWRNEYTFKVINVGDAPVTLVVK